MLPSPISDPPTSSAAAASDDVDNNLQPFFVLHKALPRKSERKSSGCGRARRKIDLPPSSPKSIEKSDVSSPEEANDRIYEQLRLQAFNRTWSKIDSTIKDVLRQINLNLFDEVQRWVLESFSNIKSIRPHKVSEIQRPYPLVTDTICRKIPTALIFTKNAEFVDDLLTFQELGGHLKSSGCHVAYLSSLDFSVKHGISGCLRSLLRQLVSEAPDMADIYILASWYCEPENYDNPILLIIDDMERCCGAVLAEFITMLSEWVIKIPIIFIMGVATTFDAPRRLLLSDAQQHLHPSKFTLGSPCEKMNALVESVLVKSCSGFSIGHKVAAFLRNYFLRHDGTITSFVRALKLACIKHFEMEPLSFLGLDIPDEDCEIFQHGQCDSLPDSLRNHAFNLPSCQREKNLKGTGGSLIHGLTELRTLQKGWSSAVMCLFEVGKQKNMQLLDIFCEAIDPTLYNLRASDHNLQLSSLTGRSLIEGKSGFAKGGFIAQAIQQVRELPAASLSHLLNIWVVHIEEMNEIQDRVRELQSIISSGGGGPVLKEKCTDIHKRSISLSAGKGTLSVNDKAAMLLEGMVRKFLMPIECVPFHEIVCFKHVDVLQSALIGDPRRTIQVDLLKSPTYLQCRCCSRRGNVLSSSMHDTSIIYSLAQEYGDIINLPDWYQSFKATVSAGTKTKRKLQHSPASKKVKATPSESEATIQARFCRAVTELQITGLIRMPSKRRPDFVQRVAFGL
ncbi:origin of replication complex subunit 3 isoform X1 [Phoenix dactylifera]|uniref:Origin of replication complex subunit 3 isoform X1 n=1 Tax=Phoenix dactylifera TaxID=42345 RepID=A0A8B9A759_PHODC|nr:origin of replication complex subunit 3 isoform X1 [Phoenix dactylifera]